MDLQNKFLEEIKKRNKVVKIFLVKGVPLLGTIEGYDKFSIIIKGDDVLQPLKSISSLLINRVIIQGFSYRCKWTKSRNYLYWTLIPRIVYVPNPQ